MKNRIIAIIQARMGSTRLPGKSMADLAGKPLLWRFLERVQRAEKLNEIVLATTTKAEDDVLVDLAEDIGVQTFRGSENDLVDRYYQAAKEYKATFIVRACADDPVIEPNEIDRIIEYHLKGDSDFSSNTHNIKGNMYPDGLGCEVMSFEILEELWKITTTPKHREHPHTYFYDNQDKYTIGTIPCPEAFRRPDLILDVNTPEELAYLRAIYEYWYPKKNNFHITDVIWWYDNIWKGTAS